MPRFVILHHETPEGHERPAHWDLMFEVPGALVAWALAEEPSSGKTISAERLADHRLAYLDYEGPVSQGRGTVTRWDWGDYTPQCTLPARWEVDLAGNRLNGRLILTQMQEEYWTLDLK